MFLEYMRLNVKRYILACKHHINEYLKIQCFHELKINKSGGYHVEKYSVSLLTSGSFKYKH